MYFNFVVKAYLGVQLFSDSIIGFCVGNEAAMFLNSSNLSLLLQFCIGKTDFFISVVPEAEVWGRIR